MAVAQSSGPPGRIELGAGVGLGQRVRHRVVDGRADSKSGDVEHALLAVHDSIRIHSTSAVGAWIGVKVTPALAIEGRLSRGRPTLRTVVSGDDELLTTTSAKERLTRYELDASVIWHLTRAAFRGAAACRTSGVARGIFESCTKVASRSRTAASITPPRG